MAYPIHSRFLPYIDLRPSPALGGASLPLIQENIPTEQEINHSPEKPPLADHEMSSPRSQSPNRVSSDEEVDTFNPPAYQELPHILGQGSSGFVQIAVELKTRSLVAIKKNYCQHPPHWREVEILRALQVAEVRHRLDIRDAFQISQNILAIITDRIPASNLNLTKARLNFSDIVTIARQLLEHLYDLKEENILHGDIKPCNILYEFNTRYTTLADNGLSFNLNRRNVAGLLLQSKFYRAPEVLCQGAVTTAADLWSLGCVLYEVMTGTALFSSHVALDDSPSSLQLQLQIIMERLSNPSWVDSVRQAGQKRGVTSHQIEAFIQLIQGMLKFESRDSIEQLLASPLFQDDISFILSHRCRPGDIIKIYRSCDLEASDHEVEPSLFINLTDRVTRTCYHIPRDHTNSYVVKIESQGQISLKSFPLRDGGILRLPALPFELPALENLNL